MYNLGSVADFDRQFQIQEIKIFRTKNRPQRRGKLWLNDDAPNHQSFIPIHTSYLISFGVQCQGEKKVNVGIIVQLSKDLMDWVSRRLCYAVGDTDRSVSWTSV